MGFKARTQRPSDWAEFLDSRLLEMVVAVEILQRLRRAAAIAGIRNGRPVEDYPTFSRIVLKKQHPAIIDPIVDAWQRLKSPKELARSIPSKDLERLWNEWEIEVREWAEPIWKARADTLRLRALRDEYRRAEDFHKGVGKHALWKAVSDSKSRPGEWISLPDGAQMTHVFADADDPQRELPPELIEELAEPVREVSEIRRLLSGRIKKALGGVRDLDARLLKD